MFRQILGLWLLANTYIFIECIEKCVVQYIIWVANLRINCISLKYKKTLCHHKHFSTNSMKIVSIVLIFTVWSEVRL